MTSPIKIEKALEAFKARMKFKLEKNKHKPCATMGSLEGKEREWSHLKTDWLIMRCRQELDELEEALRDGDIENALNECADVGNFAMFIHDNLQNGVKEI
jgi:molybdopterin converting factor small subunit